MSEWKEYTIGEICSRFSSGKSIKSSQISAEGLYPVYGGNGLRGFTDTFNFDGECSIIGRQGAYCGNVRYFKGKAFMTEHAIVAMVNENHNNGYVSNLLSMMNLAQYQGQSAQPGLSVSTISKITIKLPDLATQEQCFNVLNLIDQKIQINNQINQELEAMAKTLYDYWFVQFDFPDKNGKPYKSSGGKMVYNPELKREIPEGWGVETLVDNTLSKVIKPGIDHFTQKTYLATGDVVNTSIKDGRLITFENRETRANMQPSVNSVWFAKMKSSNKHLFLSHSMKELIDSTILSTGFMGLQCKEESFEYIASFISDPNFEIFKDTLSHGATQEAVNIDDLRSVPVIIPDDYILREFHRIAKSIFLNLGRNMIEDKTLSSLRDWLLPMLMNGQVKVE